MTYLHTRHPLTRAGNSDQERPLVGPLKVLFGSVYVPETIVTFIKRKPYIMIFFSTCLLSLKLVSVIEHSLWHKLPTIHRGVLNTQSFN